MNEPLCYGRYHKDGRVVTCDRPDDCPIITGDYKKLAREPCCLAIFIPNRFVTAAKGKLSLAARKYVEECLLE